MNINVGDYVRTRKGIDKIIDYIGKEFDDNVYEVTENGTFMPDDCLKYFIFESDIIKTSTDIIDLIEVGDIVKVEDFGWVRVSIKFEELKFFDADGTEWLYDEIESVVTKEQIEAMEYKIER